VHLLVLASVHPKLWLSAVEADIILLCEQSSDMHKYMGKPMHYVVTWARVRRSSMLSRFRKARQADAMRTIAPWRDLTQETRDQALICPDCGFVARDSAKLGAHAWGGAWPSKRPVQPSRHNTL